MTQRNGTALKYRRKPDVVEAMQWNPSDASMQDVMSWLRDEGEKFKTVGRQLWVRWIRGNNLPFTSFSARSDTQATLRYVLKATVRRMKAR